MGSVKYAENLVVTNIVKITGPGSGKEVNLRGLVLVVI